MSQFIEMFGTVENNTHNFPIMTIGEFANCFAGATPSTSHPEYWENGRIRWMSSGEVHKGHVEDTDSRITELGYKSASTRMVPIHSIVIAIAGQGKTRGTVAITEVDLCTNQSLCAIVPDERVNYSYLYHNLQGRYLELRGLSGDVNGRGGLNLKIIQKIPVILPPIEKQQQFASIAQQADKSKFGDFKSQFIEIFYGMETTPVKDYIDDSFPGEWGTEDKDGNGVKVIRTTNFTNSGKLNLADVVTRSIEDRKVVRKQIKKYDTILERSGGTADNPVGRVVLFEEDNLFLCNNFTQVLRFKDVDPRFAFYALYYFYQTNRTAIRSMGSKTTGIQNLNMSKYLEIGIPNASDEDQKAFVTIAEQADKSKSVIQKALVYLNDIQSDELGKIA